MQYKTVWFDSNTKLSDHITITQEMLITKSGKKIKSNSHPYINIGAGFDCETSRFENIVKPRYTGDKEIDKRSFEHYRISLMSFVYIWQFSIGDTIFLCREYSLFEDFIIQLNDLCNIHKNATLIIWIANIKFEWSFFKYIMQKYVTKIFAKSQNDIVTINLFNHLQFRECIGAFGDSLNKIAKNCCTTQKMLGDLDYSKIRHNTTPLSEKELQYCINDVAILSELTTYAHNTYTRQGRIIPLTQTGIVRDEINQRQAPNKFRKQALQEQYKKLLVDEKTYKYFRKYGYSGGLTHSNFDFVGKILNQAVKCYDLTSAYPWALNVKKYPSGELKKCDDLKFVFSQKHWYIDITLYNLQSKTTHSIISEHKCLSLENPVFDNGRIFKATKCRVLINEIDYDNIKKIYDFDKSNSIIHSAYYFTESKKVSKDVLNVMNEWYRKKQILKPLTTEEHKKDTNYTENVKEYKRLKALINSVYGMTVTQLYDCEYIWNDTNYEIDENNLEWNCYNNTLFNPFWGYYCTSYVRQRLVEMISKYPDNIIQYDTDSIYVYMPTVQIENEITQINNRIYRECVQNIEISECWDLGSWDIDGIYTKFICLGSKRYAGITTNGNTKITFAGACKDDLIKQAQLQSMDILEYVKNIDIEEQISNKTGAFHFSDTYNFDVTDYLGITKTCTTHGGTTIKNVQFKANLSTMFKHLQEIYGNFT